MRLSSFSSQLVIPEVGTGYSQFQGVDEHAIAREFAALPGARLMHLHHNKYELTLVLVDD